MKTLWNMTLRGHSRLRQLTLVGLILLANLVEARSNPLPTFQQYCFRATATPRRWRCEPGAHDVAGLVSDSFNSGEML
jgi:hypothetical protein